MPDIGFGLIDRRTVIIVLLSLALAHIVWGFEIPIHLDNTQQLFTELALLTGYIYLGRTLYRLPVAVIFSFRIAMFDVLSNKTQTREEQIAESEEIARHAKMFFAGQTPSGRERFQAFIRNTIRYVLHMPAGLLRTPRFLMGFGRLDSRHFILEGLWGFLIYVLIRLDRAGLVVISLLATVPNLRPTVDYVGSIGLGVMVIIFILKGTFTAVVRDPLEKQEELTESKVVVDNSANDPLYVKLVVGDLDMLNKPLRVDVTNSYLYVRDG